MTTSLRPARPGDLPDIVHLVRDLAAYEREPDAVHATEAHFRAALFPDDAAPTAFCHVACVSEDGEEQVVGLAVWFLSFSTWTGTNGIWLEDLFVLPEFRGLGLGRDLLATLAGICTERGYHRLEWWVLDWNAPSIAFYESIGARAQDEWTRYRLDGAALTALQSPGSR
ncbi:MAG: GNAT family N-acetyltransferase [Kineosporiaceae bacterium]|nr:GNAT family N-acetyltransferase [Kineosporiaceae bacterium]